MNVSVSTAINQTFSPPQGNIAIANLKVSKMLLLQMPSSTVLSRAPQMPDLNTLDPPLASLRAWNPARPCRNH
jgi:hypothetical protein